jgi:hypothetical protein
MGRSKVQSLEDYKSILKKQTTSTYTDQVFDDLVKNSVPFQNSISSNAPPSPSPSPSPTPTPTPTPTATPTPTPTPTPTFVDRTLFAKFNTF